MEPSVSAYLAPGRLQSNVEIRFFWSVPVIFYFPIWFNLLVFPAGSAE